MKPKILYIDDEQDLVEIASAFFEDEGLPIDVCTTYQSALEMIRNNKYDMIISDANMPTGSGKELVSLVRKEGSFCGKSILVTGNIENMDDEENQSYEMIVIKPLHFQEFINKVKKLILL